MTTNKDTERAELSDAQIADLLPSVKHHPHAVRYEVYCFEDVCAAVRKAASLLAADKPAESGGESLESLLSTAVGIILGYRTKIGYLPGSAIDKEVQKAVDRLKDWNFDDTYTSHEPQPSALPDDVVKDAERYRFVRTADKVAISTEAARDPVAYDAAIDAAMLKEGNRP